MSVEPAELITALKKGVRFPVRPVLLLCATMPRSIPGSFRSFSVKFTKTTFDKNAYIQDPFILLYPIEGGICRGHHYKLNKDSSNNFRNPIEGVMPPELHVSSKSVHTNPYKQYLF
jgi:hypothetical protein